MCPREYQTNHFHLRAKALHFVKLQKVLFYFTVAILECASRPKHKRIIPVNN